MVFLAITAAGLRDALRLHRDAAVAVWCGSDALSEADYAALTGANVSRFAYPLQSAGGDVLTGAIETIQEHHPNETIWVEQCA